MVKKRVDITIDSEIYQVIEEICSEERFKPSISKVINSFLKENQEIKKRLKNNGKK